MSDLRRIDSREDLRAFARQHGLRTDWHEPDEQEVHARIDGTEFDNAGYWPRQQGRAAHVEMHVILSVAGHDIAAVNLATLLAWAAEQ